MLRTHVRPLVVGLAFATAATAGYAQQLEEVVVTAQKREQSLSDVPISVSAVGGELIQDAAIKSFTELGAYVPNLSITENAVNSIISMRGIGVGAQQSFEQSVGVFVDGVHLGKSRQARLGLFDLQQVEVLRGPQGILFGKNTLAGAVNVRTASPELGGEAEGRFAVSKESYNGTIYEGWFQTSITDDLAIRFAARETNTDGYLDNSYASEANGATTTGPTTDESIWRASIKWQPTDSTSVEIKYTESEFERVGSTATVTTLGDASLDPAGIPASNSIMYAVMGLGFPDFITGSSDLYRDSKTIGGAILSGGSTFKGPNERDEGTITDNEEFSLNVQYEFDNGVTMNYVYGDSYYGYEDGIDADFLPVEFIGRSDDSTYDQESHELRFTGSVGDNFDWIGGLNYVDSVQKISRSVVVDGTLGQPGLVSAILGGAYNANPDAVAEVAAVAPGFIGASGGLSGTPSFLALSPFDLIKSTTDNPLLIGNPAFGLSEAQIEYFTENGGVDVADILTADGLSAFWAENGDAAQAQQYAIDAATYRAMWQAGVDGAAALYGFPLSGLYGVDGATMANATNRLSYWQQDTESTAAFFQGTYRFDDEWSITAGVRYTKETKDVYAMTELGQSATGLANPQSPEDAAFLHGVLASSFATWAHEFEDGRSTTQTIPGVTLQWEPNDNSNYYLAYTEGFKSGGFNSVDDQNPDFAIGDDGLLDTDQPIRNVPGPGFEYDDENATSWEIGGKHRLMDGRMQLNWAAYSSSYENLQVSTFVGLGFIVANAAEAEIEGFEFDVNFQATQNLRLSLAMGFNDGAYGSFPGAGCSAIQQNGLRALAAASATGDAGDASAIVGQSFLGCTQKSVTQQSQDLGGAQIGTDYNGTAQIEYIQPLSNNMMWFTQVDYNFTDGYFLQGDRVAQQYQDSYGRVNFRTGLRTDNWFLQAYGRNVLDEEFASGGFNVPLAQGSFARYQGQGAVFGFQAAYQF
jgi:outer membrane receptor protein involved in Fe transport